MPWILAIILGVFVGAISFGSKMFFQGTPLIQPGLHPVMSLLDAIQYTVPQISNLKSSITAFGFWKTNVIEVAIECIPFAMIFRYFKTLIWAAHLFILKPLLLKPTDWFLELITKLYGWLLKWSLRYSSVVLMIGLLMAGATATFLMSGILGQELVPSEDQSRLLVHVICPVGASIEEIGNLLAKCETKLADRNDVACIMTAVATESGLLMNEADIFVQLVP